MINVALFKPDIPQNTASIIRSCSCLGSKLEIIEPCGFLFSDKRFKRVAMDYMDKNLIKFYQCSEHFFECKENQRIILMTTKASVSYTKFKFEINDTILFGSESSGVPEKIHKTIHDKFKIKICIITWNIGGNTFQNLKDQFKNKLDEYNTLLYNPIPKIYYSQCWYNVLRNGQKISIINIKIIY